jgi:hypothetical protein
MSRSTAATASPLTTGTSKYRSKFEQQVAGSLNKRGLSFNYEGQALPYTIQATYTPDFCLPNGVMVETKGLFPPEDRRKMLAIKAQYPELDIRICFMKADVKLSRRPKALTYGAWATKHGFVWCEKHIPTTWFDAIQVPAA